MIICPDKKLGGTAFATPPYKTRGFLSESIMPCRDQLSIRLCRREQLDNEQRCPTKLPGAPLKPITFTSELTNFTGRKFADSFMAVIRVQ